MLKTTLMDISNKIKTEYAKYLLEEGKVPNSVYLFAKKIKITEQDFYKHYNSFLQIESDIWKSFIVDTVVKIQNDEVYLNYSVREKLLSYFYTLIETLKKDRSLVLLFNNSLEKPIQMKKNSVLIDAKTYFEEFASELILEGKETREIEQRPIPQLIQKYPNMLWMINLNIIDFWITDFSKEFEKTDTYIEKLVNTSMDWLGRTPFDSLFDLGKFMFQNKK